jgi:hypothetical protein
LPTGCADLDRVLGGGWPAGSVTELLVDGAGLGEIGLLVPALANLLHPDREASSGWVMWVAPPYVPYAPALSGAGLDLGRLLIVRVRQGNDIAWVAEQAIRSGVCAAVLVWPEDSARHAESARALRRLQVAAVDSACRVFVYRHLNTARQASAAPLRICIAPEPGGLRLDIFKRRGGGAVTLAVPRNDRC